MIKRRWLWVSAALCLLLFLPGLCGPFTFDSVTSLSRNEALGRDVGSLQAWLLAIDSSTAGPTGRPVSMLTFALSHGFFGHSAFLEKSLNLFLHLGIGLLLYRWLLLLLVKAPALRWSETLSSRVAFGTALFWLLNPLHVSTVLYAVQRMEQLSALFTLAGLYVYTRCRSAWVDRVAEPYEVSRLLFLLALTGSAAVLSKEDGVLLLPLLALLEATLFRGEYAGRVRPALHLMAFFTCLLPLVFALIFPLLASEWLQQRGAWRGIDSGDRLLTQARVLWHYVSWFYWPDISRMSLFHDDIVISRGWLLPWTTLVAVAGWISVLLASVVVARRMPLLGLGIGLYLISHGIESSIIPLDLVYEHRNYLGSAGLALLLVAGLQRLLSEKHGLIVLPALTLPFCLALGWRSVLWGDEQRLYETQLRYHPTSERTLYYYANLRLRQADEAEPAAQARDHVLLARQYFEHLLALDPLHMPSLVSLLYIDSRWFPGLSRELTYQALEKVAMQRVMEPSDFNAIELWNQCLVAGFCDISEERLVAMFNTLAERYPHSAIFPAFLARYYGEVRGDPEQAITYSLAAIDIAPSDPLGYYQLASWYLAQGQRARAALVMGQLLGLDPGLATVSNVEQALN